MALKTMKETIVRKPASHRIEKSMTYEIRQLVSYYDMKTKKKKITKKYILNCIKKTTKQ